MELRFSAAMIIGVPKQIRRQIGKSFGDIVEVVLKERGCEKLPVFLSCGQKRRQRFRSAILFSRSESLIL